jgi:hypothetical protein
MVSAGVCVPVRKSVSAAVTIQAALSRARLSVTVTAPSDPEAMPPGAAELKFAEPGTVIDSMPTVTVKVTMVSGSPAGGALDEEYASAAGWSIAADAAPGDSAIPMANAAARMRNTDMNIGPPIN